MAIKVFTKVQSGFNKCLNNVKANYGKYLCKTAAIGTLGLLAYDANFLGKLQADTYAKSQDAKHCIKAATNTLFLDEPSKIDADIKNQALHVETDQNARQFFNTAIGYVKGFTNSLINNVIPFGVAMVTLLTGKKPIWKIGGFTMLGYGIYKVLKDGFGIGSPKDIVPKY